jgi:hypothetical protein
MTSLLKRLFVAVGAVSYPPKRRHKPLEEGEQRNKLQ